MWGNVEFQVYYSPTDIIVSFEILDVAPIVGDVLNRAQETPLDVAANTLKTKVQNSQFAIALDSKVFPNVSLQNYNFFFKVKH